MKARKTKTIIGAIFISVFLAFTGYAVTTTTVTKHAITILGLDADWTLASDASLDQIKLRRITFYPSGANDRMIVRDGVFDASSNNVLYDSGLCTDAYDIRTTYYNGESVKPYIDISDCTTGTTTSVKLVIQFD